MERHSPYFWIISGLIKQLFLPDHPPDPSLPLHSNSKTKLQVKICVMELQMRMSTGFFSGFSLTSRLGETLPQVSRGLTGGAIVLAKFVEPL